MQRTLTFAGRLQEPSMQRRGKSDPGDGAEGRLNSLCT